MLKTRLLVSSTYGTKVLNNEDQLRTIFDQWKNHLNVEYVMVTEDLINDGNNNFYSIFSIQQQIKDNLGLKSGNRKLKSKQWYFVTKIVSDLL